MLASRDWREAHRIRIAALLVLSVVALDCAPKKLGEACKEGKGECAALLLCDFDVCRKCIESSGCKEEGRCAYFADRCVATPDGCKDSDACKNARRCTLWEGVCVEKIPKRDDGHDNKEGGCPCGCDHSEEMITELEGAPTLEALRAARSSLAVIGEREQAGYITEAMVAHRLRLRGLERMRGAGSDRLELQISPRVQTLRDARSSLPERQLGAVALREQLVVYGATVETVRGRPKELLPCFRLWLSLQNTTPERRVVARPTLTGDVGFDVRRWYVEGTDGEPWSGVLEPGESKSVLVIGYIERPIQPGRLVEATLVLEGGSVTEQTSALGRWDALL